MVSKVCKIISMLEIWHRYRLVYDHGKGECQIVEYDVPVNYMCDSEEQDHKTRLKVYPKHIRYNYSEQTHPMINNRVLAGLKYIY